MIHEEHSTAGGMDSQKQKGIMYFHSSFNLCNDTKCRLAMPNEII